MPQVPGYCEVLCMTVSPYLANEIADPRQTVLYSVILSVVGLLGGRTASWLQVLIDIRGQEVSSWTQLIVLCWPIKTERGRLQHASSTHLCMYRPYCEIQISVNSEPDRDITLQISLLSSPKKNLPLPQIPALRCRILRLPITITSWITRTYIISLEPSTIHYIDVYLSDRASYRLRSKVLHRCPQMLELDMRHLTSTLDNGHWIL